MRGFRQDFPKVLKRGRVEIPSSGTARLTLTRGAEVEVPLDHPHLSHGWWAVERDPSTLWRWTDGDGVIPLSVDGPAMFEIAVAASLDYPLSQEREARATGRAALHSAAAQPIADACRHK
jgi:hypothetical protein